MMSCLNMMSLLTFALSQQPKLSVISNFIVIPLCLNKLRLNLKGKTTENMCIAKKLIFFIIY